MAGYPANRNRNRISGTSLLLNGILLSLHALFTHIEGCESIFWTDGTPCKKNMDGFQNSYAPENATTLTYLTIRGVESESRVLRSPGFGPASESLIWRETPTPDPVSSGLLYTSNFVAVYLTFTQWILQLKLCLYTTVHLLFVSVCHTIRARL